MTAKSMTAKAVTARTRRPLAALRRFGRQRPLISATLESFLTGASVLVWFALAVLLDLENMSSDPWDPDYPSARPFYLLAYVTAGSLLLTRLLRGRPGLPGQRLGRAVDLVIAVRAGVVIVLWTVLVCAAAVG